MKRSPELTPGRSAHRRWAPSLVILLISVLPRSVLGGDDATRVVRAMHRALAPFVEVDNAAGATPRGPLDVQALAEIAASCRATAPSDPIRCITSGVSEVHGSRISPASDPVPLATTVNGGEASCLTMTILGLAMADAINVPARAIVFRDHVAIANPDHPGMAYETLEGGRSVAIEMLERRHQPEPTGLRRVSLQSLAGEYAESLAIRAAARNRLDTAGELFELAIRRAPESARVHYNYGTFLLRAGEHELALTTLTRAADLGWVDARVLVNRGIALQHLGRVQEACAAFDAALREDPTYRLAQQYRARLLQRDTNACGSLSATAEESD